jgi:hypothetical protein
MAAIVVVMRVAIATVVVLLLLNFVDEHFNDARYTRAATAMLSHIARSFCQAASIGGLFVRLAFPIGQYFWRYPYSTLVS